MVFTLTPRRMFRGRLKSSYEERLIPLDIHEDGHFSLKISANGSWPMVSLETTSGKNVRSELAYNKGFAKTGFLDADQFSEDSLVARISMQSGHTGKFRLKLNNLGNLSEIQDDVIRMTNKERRQEGLRKLKADSPLNQ